jgi:two-component system, NtrC family, sensor kinase
MGLRQRVILIITIPALIATGVHGTLRVRQERAQLLSEYHRNLSLTAKAIQIAIENALRDRQWSDVGHLASQMVEQQDVIERIRVFDREATPVFVSNPLKIADTIPVEALRRVATSGVPEEVHEQRGTQSFVATIVPVKGHDGGIVGAMEIVGLTTGMDRRLHAAVVDVLVRLGLLLAVTVGFTAFVLQRQVLRPLGRLAEGIERLGRGETGVTLAIGRRDELGQVAQRFNEMVARLQDARRRLLVESERALALEQQARQAGALAVAGKLAVALAHEVGTPLNIISGRAEFILRRAPRDDPARADLEAIVGQIDRISRIITTLLDAVRPQAPKLESVPIADVVRELWPLLGVAARQRGVKLIDHVDQGLPAVQADAGQLQQVLINLVVNAVEATPAGGEVIVSARDVARDGRAGLALAVSDTGSGIAPDLHERIFETFFSTKPRGRGTGLGLAISRDIARAHGGDIAVESSPGAGSTFTVWLPAAGEADRPPA